MSPHDPTNDRTEYWANMRQATQIKYPTRATIRTLLWSFVGFCIMAVPMYEAATQQDASTATGLAAIALAITGAVNRVMALPVVNAWLEKWLPWLAAAPVPPNPPTDPDLEPAE